jgi:predicted flap endonuclease-1-like 5' DNA nuclease
MGRLTEDMTNLRDGIDALRNGRVEFIAGLKHGMSELKSDVADMQQGFRKDHTRMAGNMKDNLKAFMAGTESYVSNLKNDVVDMQDNFRSDHADMARKLKDGLSGFASGITSSVADLMDLFSDDRAEMAGNMKDSLKAFMAETESYVSNLKNDVADMQDNFRNDHADMAGKLKENLQMFAAGIKSTVSDLEKQFRNEHIETTGKAGAERQMFFSNVKQSLADLKLKTTDLLQDISDDLAGARRAWSGATPAGKRAAGKVRRPGKVRVEPDDLTQINGIGPVMSRRLNEAGIFTFAKLASSTIEEIRGALGESSKFANFEMWVKEAGKLSS